MQREPESEEVNKLLATAATIAGNSVEGYEFRDILSKAAEVRVALDMGALPKVHDSAGRETRQRSEGYQAQARLLRQGRWTKLRFAALIGKRDVAKDNAWAFLDAPKHTYGLEALEGDKHDSVAPSLLVSAFAEVRLIYEALCPQDTGATRFFERLRSVVNKAIAKSDNGVSYVEAGRLLWTPLAAKLQLRHDAYVQRGADRLELDADEFLAESVHEVKELMEAASEIAQRRAIMRAGGRGRSREPGERGRGRARTSRVNPGSERKLPSKRESAAEDEDLDVEEPEEESDGGGVPEPRTEHKKKHTGPCIRSKDKTRWLGAGKQYTDVAALRTALGTTERLCKFFFSEAGCRESKKTCKFAHVGQEELVK